MKAGALFILLLVGITGSSCATMTVASQPQPYESISQSQFYDDLAPYGRWVQLNHYGLVWQPWDLPYGWRPYSDGYWVYTDYGWTFESDAPCVQAFSTSLATILSDVEDAVITGSPCVLNLAGDHAWQFVRLTVGDQRPLDRDQVRALLRDLPDTLMSSEIRLQLGVGDWLIGRLRQGRYWTRSQARLLALDLIDHGLFAKSDS